MQRRRPPKNIFKINQLGQALIEYIALLFISVLIILGVIYQFNDAFRVYINAWFGPNESGYLYCLIQNGLLPGESEICSIPSFNIKNGKGLTGSIDGAGGGTGTGAAGAGKKGGGGGVGGGGVSLSGDRFAGGGGLVPYGPAGGAGANGFGGADGKGGGKNGAGSSVGGTGDLDFSNVGRQKGSQNSKGKLSGVRGPRGSLGADMDLGSGKVQGGPNVPATERDLNPARFVSAEKQKRLQSHYQDVDASFSFGKILKYLFILIIGFSILFFVGSQLVAISRGKRKRN